LNILLIISDSLRADACGCYGGFARTPCIDGLARRGTRFLRCHAASFPTGPMRKDLHSGRFTFTYTPWAGELDRGEALLAVELKRRGYATAFVGDSPGAWAFDKGFDHFERVEAQRADPGEPRHPPLPAPMRKFRCPKSRVERAVRQRAAWREEDTPVAQTMRAACRWLESEYGRRGPFFLCVDTFDPHEPWLAPRYYLDMYDPGYRGDELIDPAYEPADYASRREIEHMRWLYAAEVTLVDRWVGYLLDALERMRLADSTAVIFSSDHGFYHGEHGLIGKVRLNRRDRIVGRYPLYATMTHIPLIIRVPGLSGPRVHSAFCQPPDIMPTILNLVGARIPGTVQGLSLVPLMRSEKGLLRACPARDAAVSSCTYVQDDTVRCPTSLRTSRYLYVCGGDEWPSELFDLRADPEERKNIIARQRRTAERLHSRLLQFLEDIECPQERIAGRREFMPRPRRTLPRHRVI
jgi:arylsulfatase A-like enzyme